MLFYLKRNKNPNSSPRIQLTSLNKELYSLRNNSIDFAVKWRNSFIKFSNKIQTTGSSASYWAENENDKNLYECLNEISIYLTDFETQSKSWLSCQKNWINLLKELSENETNYINKEKEYFKILSKLHDITKQIRNYDQELQENSNHENNNNNNNNDDDNNDNDNDNDNDNNKNNTKEPKKSKSSLLSLGKNSKKDVLISNNNKNRKEQSGKGEIEEEINEKIEESEEREKNNSKRNNERNHMEKEEDLNDQKIIKNINKTNNDNKNETSNINDNDNNNNNNNDNVHNNNNNNNNTMTKGIKSKSIVIRNKNSYHHLIHVQNKLKKEFLKYFNENQKQLDTIYLIKELKVPTTLYKLIQESSKMWNHFIKTYGKFEESLNKLQNSEDEDEIIKNKNSIDKLNLNFDHQEEVIDRMNKESEYVKKYSPTKTQLENIKVWMKNSIKWIKSLEETFNYQKNHIQFVSKWLHESYKNHIFEKQISMLKLNDIVNQKSTHHHSSPSTSNTNKIENEDSEFIHTIINIYNNRINKNNSKYYNILYKTSLADKKRDEFLRNCEWNKTLIGTSSDKEDNYDSKNKNKSKSKSKNRKKKRSNDDDNDNDDDDKHEYNNNNDNGHDNDDDDDDNDDHNSDNEHHKSKHKHEHPQENQINNMIMTQKNKYSHHHIHLSYIYLFQTFGELTNALEENILSNVNIFNQIYSQIINRYGDLKKQSNIVWKIVNDIKKNIHAYHDEKIFHVIKSKKKQKNRLRKLSHDFEIQKYKLDSMIREFYEFKRNEILHEYGKIIESVKGSSYEYLELCSNIITEYDILNSKKAHKEKELMAKKLMQLTTTKHEKLEIKNNLNENINNSNSSSKKNLSKHDDKTKSISEKEIGKVKVKEKDKDKDKEKEREKRKLEELKEKMMKASKEKIVNATFLEKKTTSEKTISKKTKTGRNDNTHGKKNSNDNGNSNNNSNSNSTKKKKGHRSNSNNKKERSKEKFDIISIIESGEALDSYDLTSNKINDYYQTPMVYTYEESIPEDNHSAVINMLHNLPNTVNDNIPISPKNSISKSKASSIKSKKEYDYNYDFSYEPNYHNNNNNNSNNNINYSVTSHNNNNYNYGFGYDYSYNHLNHDIHQNINSNTNRTGDLTTATTTTTMIATTTTTTTTTTPTATATAIAPMMNPLATLTLTPTITTESPPATPPPQYTSPKWKKSMTLGAGATLYYPGPPPPPPVPAITSEFPNFLNQVATAASPSTLDQIMPGSRPGLNPNDGNSQPSAPPMDSYMYNLRSNVNII